MSILSERLKPKAAAGGAPLWVRGDTNAFFGLGFNILVNVLVLTGLCIGVIHISKHDVYLSILPALGIQLLVGNVYYTFLARRLARREGRQDVTAMPYGPSVPHMFIVTFLIMLPVYLKTKNPLKAWETGIAWAFVIGVIVLIGAFVGPYIRRFTPRAALLGTLAGISIAFIAMRPAAQMFEAAWIALPVFTIIVVGFFTDLKLPGGIPVGLAALLVGTAIGWIGGYMSVPDVSSAAKDIAIGLPTFHFHMLFQGLKDVSPLLATAIPLGVYNFTEGMTNVESASVAGDSYNLRSVLFADGSGAIIGAALGSPFPPAVYIGHPGWKAAGGRTGYSMGVGIVIAVLCFLGMFGLLGALLPLPAIVPILLYIGLLIGAQAFQTTPKVHAAAIVIALIPNIASWAQGSMSDVLAAAGTTAEKVGYDNIAGAGVIYKGLLILGSGAVLVGLILGAIVSFLIDKRFYWAAGFALVGSALSFIGLIHAPKVKWDANGQVSLGYLLVAVLCVLFAQRHATPLDHTEELAALDEAYAKIEVPEPAAESPDAVTGSTAPETITLPEPAPAPK